MKCRVCNIDKKEDEFHNCSASKSGKLTICKSCKRIRDNQRNSKPDIIKRHRDQAASYRNANRQIMYDYMKSKCCVECGEKDICCLQFDHRNPEDKCYNISSIISRQKWDTILKEIDKCDIVCANCHTRRTAKQQEWYKGLK